jgi:hypothetical protein
VPSPSSIAAADNLAAADSPKAKQCSFVEWIALWLVAVAAAAIAAGFLVDRFGSPFRIPAEITAGFGAQNSAEDAARLGAVVRTINRNNLLVTFALAGAVIGLAFGLAAGIALRSWSGTMRGVLGGAAWGCLFGLGGGWVTGFASDRLHTLAAVEDDHKIIFALLAGWAFTGVGVGWGASLSYLRGRTMAKAALAGFAGGLIGGAVYVPLVAFLAPSVDTALLIPEGLIGKFYWVAFPAALMGISLARSLAERAPEPERL